MKNKIVKYMINKGINFREFADLVGFGTESARPQVTNPNHQDRDGLSVFDVILACAVVIVGIFLVAIFL